MPVAQKEMSLRSEKEHINSEIIMYLNRLSDYLFVLGRVLNNKGAQDVLWIPAENQTEKAN